MKKTLSLILCFIMIISCFSCVSFADSEIKIIVDGNALTMDQNPIIVEGRTLVPLRAIFEALGAKVEWDDATKTATGVLGATTVSLQINNTVAKVNGKDVTLDVPAQIVNSRTLVPVRFISESLGCKVDWEDATKTVTIASVGETVFELNFDDKTTFEENKDFIIGGLYKGENVSLSSDLDHTTSVGKSLKIGKRTASNDRVKIVNAFSDAKIGETYVISAWAYLDTDTQKMSIAVFGDKGTSFAYTAPARKTYPAKANTWTYLEVEYTYDNEEITQIGFDQGDVKEGIASTIYIDDIKITKKKVAENTLLPVVTREGKRPTPVAKDTGKTYDDLIFYDREFKDNISLDEVFNSLPKDPKVLSTNEKMLNASLMGQKYATVEKIKVDGMPFSEALRADVKIVPAKPYDAQIVIDSLPQDGFKTGDNMLCIFYMRTVSSANEIAQGQVQLIVEQEVSPNNKTLQEDVKTLMGPTWKKVYVPFAAKEGYTRLCIRLGYNVQTVEFGGYEILNYENKVDFMDLPSSTTMEVYDKKELFQKDVEWRKDAWARIEEIRRGDIKVIVKDENGNVIPDADVKIDMYDHEFKWGAAINGTIMKEDTFGKNYRQAIAALYNTAVEETSHKPVEYINHPEVGRRDMEKAFELGLKNFRGHTLVWDRSNTFDPETGVWKENTSVSEELSKLIYAGDKEKIDAYMKNTIQTTVTDFKDEICEWDVANEVLSNKEIRSKYGNEVLVNWFKWAREADPDTKLYINETGIVGNSENGKMADFKKVLDDMVKLGVDFDGIGIQGHIGTYVSPYDFYKEIMELVPYNKQIKITEYDTSILMAKDKEADASFMRDIMILMFSIENMDGFLSWGIIDNTSGTKNYPIFDKEWNLKLSGEQYIDLVYNKWWTQEDGKTDANGTYALKGYYGDYLITATANGVSKTVDVKHYKGNTDTIEIVLD